LNSLPLSYHYYDSILMLAQQRVTKDRVLFFKLKKRINEMFDKKMSLKEALGLGKVISKFKNKKK